MSCATPEERGKRLAKTIELFSSGAAKVDPYLFWALVTGLKGVGEARNPDRPWQIAAQLVDGVDAKDRERLRQQGFILDPKMLAVRCTTAQLTFDGLSGALRDACIKRLEFCRPLAEGTRGVHPLGTPVDQPLKLGGLVIAVIDDACAFAHAAFRFSESGRWRSRIGYLWDQGAPAARRTPWKTPNDFGYGAQIGLPPAKAATENKIDTLFSQSTRPDGSLDEDKCYAAADYAEHVAASITHGTHVLSIAAGRPNPLRHPTTGSPDDAAAQSASIVFVQLPRSTVNDTSGASMGLFVIDALRYVLNRVEDDAQLVVNLSYGSFASAHDGTSILESAIDEMLAQRPDFAVVLPAGNSYAAGCHARVTLSREMPSAALHLHLRADDPSDTFVEVWCPLLDENHARVAFTVTLKPPGAFPASEPVVAGDCVIWDGGGRWASTSSAWFEPTCAVLRLPATALTDKPMALVLLAFAPTREGDSCRPVAPHGVWEIKLELLLPNTVADVCIDAWIERDDQALGSGRSRSQAFFCDAHGSPMPAGQLPVDRHGTLSNIACGANTVVVGGCLLDGSELANYSSAGAGHGSARPDGPDVVAPSDESITLPGLLAAGTRSETWVRMSGTSVAAPIVTRRLANILAARADAGEDPVSAAQLKHLLLQEADDRLPSAPKTDLEVRRGGGFVAPAP